MENPATRPTIFRDPLILLVDETEFFLKIQRQFLRNSIVEIETAANGKEALAFLRQRRPDLVFMDRGAPGMTGVQCCRAIKSDRLLTSMPVIMICDAKDPREALMCREAGCDGLLTKPIDRHSFLRLGRQFLPSIDQRERRVLCHATVFFQRGGEKCYAKAVDLSAGGMFFETDLPLKVGERLNLAFNLPGGSVLVEIQSRVIWTNAKDKPCRSNYPTGAGVEFLDLSSAIQGELRRIVDDNLQRTGKFGLGRD